MSLNELWTKLFSGNNKADELALHVSGATVRHRNPFESLEVPRNEQELSPAIIEKWVVPFYLPSFGNADETTISKFAQAAKEINVDIVKSLLGDFNWRTRTAGAFFAAINDYQELEQIIGNHLLKSEVSYAGSAYCLTLAGFGSEKAKDYLDAYLHYYLDRPDLWFDQGDAFCALEYLDKNRAANLLDKWNSFAADKEHWRLENFRERFNRSMATLDSIRKEME